MRRSTRGQVLILSCVTLLLLALTMMASFTLSSAIHERIRIQSQADAQAYSVATLEARGLNIMVYTNRTIAAVVVTNMSVHAWHAIASETVSILSASRDSMSQVAAAEARCCTLGEPACCADARTADAITQRFGSEAASWSSLIQGTEPAFNTTVDGLNKAAAALHALQKRTLDKVDLEISSPNRGTLKALQERNAPRSTWVPEVHGINRREFACAVEGWTQDDTCQTLLGLTRPRLPPPQRSVIIQDVSNAARGSFQQYCAQGRCELVGHRNFAPGSPYLLGLMGGEGKVCLGFDGKSGVTTFAHALPPKNLWEAESVGSETHGGLMIGWRQGRGSAPLGSVAFSDALGGVHDPGHSGPHVSFKGIQRQEVCQGPDQSCFINFRGVDPSTRGNQKGGGEVALSVDELDRGLPSAWGAVKQDLSLMRGGKRGPWLLNEEGAVTLTWGPGAKPTMRLKPGEAVAVSKAKVYFHELGSERVPVPNLFDPFFRAKLEHFRCRQLVELLTIAGDFKGAELVRDYRSPVEGIRQTVSCSEETKPP